MHLDGLLRSPYSTMYRVAAAPHPISLLISHQKWPVYLPSLLAPNCLCMPCLPFKNRSLDIKMRHVDLKRCSAYSHIGSFGISQSMPIQIQYPISIFFPSTSRKGVPVSTTKLRSPVPCVPSSVPRCLIRVMEGYAVDVPAQRQSDTYIPTQKYDSHPQPQPAFPFWAIMRSEFTVPHQKLRTYPVPVPCAMQSGNNFSNVNLQ